MFSKADCKLFPCLYMDRELQFSLTGDIMDHSESDNRFYVYTHTDVSGRVVYVGSGTGNRVNSKNGRSRQHLLLWSELSKEIIVTSLSKFESIEMEKLIYNSCIVHSELLNKAIPVNCKDIKYSDISKFIKYDENSPTLLSWSSDRGNNVKVGIPVGSVSTNGYVTAKVNGVSYRVHRLIYVLFNKEDLPHNLVIDHINRVKTDNRPSNLRLSTTIRNCNNRYERPDNSSDVTGVSWDNSGKGRWKAFWLVDTKLKTKSFTCCKLYPDIPPEEAKQKAFEDAVAYRKQMEELYYNKPQQ